MTDANEVAISKATTPQDLGGLHAGAALHKAFSEQTEAEFVECWLTATSEALEADLRVQMKRVPQDQP
ncbi:hypothetical protein A2419_00110 [Candidatus Adlerbacteria bacterium RIFOXYC1_FULL_48_26]|uniref:Uncharacterized protein n=1 Tax=Candidatus Adlerbacteria bacterium RIFOXYC1_FULL_48_26 TaxID=1797247 RepID=A0A1F4Y2R5_9BACT|nr:MAG: hypothetical protein A2419_00110 [Candidatus Adlerbacteria bacterium RIFOXYC1_FULL_48_26]OGC93367.1 MAG: hypothetical protein A2389_02810 [Candidatus Adlerbacteria bacterium RIFOXYB1_FULL_48_10]